MAKFFRFWFPVICYSGIIFCVSSVPNLKPLIDVNHFDKVCHFGEYVPLGFLISRALMSVRADLKVFHLTGWTAFLVFLYALTDEYHQSFVPGRSADITDVVADVLGGALGGFLCFLFYQYKIKERTSFRSQS